MRPKVVFALLLFAFAVLAAVFFLRPHSEPAKPAPVASAPVPMNVAPPAPAAPVVVAPPVVAPVVKANETPEEHQAAIDAEKDRLYDWSMSRDPNNLSNILADLNSPEKEIRMAAIEATKQLDNTNAIPALKAAAVNAADTEEEMAMLQAADFISLPQAPLVPYDPSQEHLTPEQVQAQAQSQANAQARQQTYLQQDGQGPQVSSVRGQSFGQGTPGQ